MLSVSCGSITSIALLDLYGKEYPLAVPDNVVQLHVIPPGYYIARIIRERGVLALPLMKQ